MRDNVRAFVAAAAESFQPAGPVFEFGSFVVPGQEHIVSQRTDESVWLTIRAFSRPSSRWWWAVYPALRAAQWYYTRRYLRALAAPID